MSGSYFNGCGCSQPGTVWAPATRVSNKALIVLNEASVLSLEAGQTATQIIQGDFVLVLAATSKTNPNGLLMVVDTANVGTWSAFAVVGNPKLSTLQTVDPHVAGVPWNNGGFQCISNG